MSLLLHACAGRVSYATQLHAAADARTRAVPCDWSLCSSCGRWHVDARPVIVRVWAAVRRAVTP
jgi:hypothetical protein